MHNSEHGVDGEKRDHDRAEEGCNSGRPSALGGEQHNEDDDGRGQDVGREIGVDLLQALERGENRNRRRDDASPENRAEPATPSRNAIGVFCPRAR